MILCGNEKHTISIYKEKCLLVLIVLKMYQNPFFLYKVSTGRTNEMYLTNNPCGDKGVYLFTVPVGLMKCIYRTCGTNG